MNIKKCCKIFAVSLISPFTSQAYAAASYLSEGHLSLEVIQFVDSQGNQFDVGDQPSSISLSSTIDDEESTFSKTGDALANAVSTTFAESGLMDLDVQSSGFTGTPYALALSDSIAAASFSFKNISADDFTVELFLTYDFSGSIEADTPSAQQNGNITFEMDLFGDFALGNVLSVSDATELGRSSFSGLENGLSISFLLAAGEVENVFANISSFGESESFSDSASPVPVPAAFYLMAWPLLGLFTISKRKKIIAT